MNLVMNNSQKVKTGFRYNKVHFPLPAISTPTISGKPNPARCWLVRRNIYVGVANPTT